MPHARHRNAAVISATHYSRQPFGSPLVVLRSRLSRDSCPQREQGKGQGARTSTGAAFASLRERSAHPAPPSPRSCAGDAAMLGFSGRVAFSA